MDSLLTKDVILDRLPIAMCGIIHVAVNNRIGVSKINVNICKQV